MIIMGISSVHGEIVDRIVAVVNDDIITHLEVQKEMVPYEEKIKAVGYDPEQEKQMLYKVRSDIVKKMVEKKIVIQESKRYNIKVSKEDIDRNIEQLKKANFWTDEEFRKMLEAEGVTVEAYRESLKEQALRNRLISVAVRSNVVVTREDIEAYYNRNIDKYGGELTYHLRHIILQVSEDASDKQKQAVLERMEALYEALGQGAVFTTLAEQHSESPLASEGGDLGNLAYENFSPQLKDALAGLVPGAYTPILDTDQGYQIFYIEEILMENEVSLEAASNEIQDILFKEQSEKAFSKWLKELRESSHVKIIL